MAINGLHQVIINHCSNSGRFDMRDIYILAVILVDVLACWTSTQSSWHNWLFCEFRNWKIWGSHNITDED